MATVLSAPAAAAWGAEATATLSLTPGTTYQINVGGAGGGDNRATKPLTVSPPKIPNLTDKTGNRRIRVTADPEDQIVETDEMDNESTKALRIGSEDETPPDLPNVVVLAGNVKFEPSSPKAGDLVTITVSVLNEGMQPADAVLVRLLDVTDGASEPIGEATITGTIAVGESGVMSVTFDTANKSGTRQIQVTADPDNTIEESDEEDNQVVKALTIGAAATAVAEAQRREGAGSVNLTVQIEGVAVESLGENDSLLTITATVQNASDAVVEGVLVQFMDKDAGAAGLGGLQRLPQVLPSGSAAAHFSFVLPGPVTATELRTIEVMVDPYDAIAEVDEADNQTSQAVDVAALRAEPMEVSVMP